jgi:hypothetical protein
MNKKAKVHKALGRGGRARVTEITIKSKPIKIPMRAREPSRDGRRRENEEQQVRGRRPHEDVWRRQPH